MCIKADNTWSLSGAQFSSGAPLCTWPGEISIGLSVPNISISPVMWQPLSSWTAGKVFRIC